MGEREKESVGWCAKGEVGGKTSRERRERERQERSGFGRSGGGAKAIEEEGETRGKSEAKSTIACYAGSNC